MTLRIALSRIHYPITALGPGRRVGIWVQGCSIRCPGCISADTWAPGSELQDLDAVMSSLERWLAIADGITVSGGEPFDQPLAVFGLLERIRNRFDGDILIYTGYDADVIAGWLDRGAGLIDALISGPYHGDSPQTLPLRGSDNQRLHLLTPLGRERFDRYLSPTDDAPPPLDVMFDEDGAVWLAGIPRQGSFEALRALLTASGHRVTTSQDRSGSTVRLGQV